MLDRVAQVFRAFKGFGELSSDAQPRPDTKPQGADTDTDSDATLSESSTNWGAMSVSAEGEGSGYDGSGTGYYGSGSGSTGSGSGSTGSGSGSTGSGSGGTGSGGTGSGGSGSGSGSGTGPGTGSGEFDDGEFSGGPDGGDRCEATANASGIFGDASLATGSVTLMPAERSCSSGDDSLPSLRTSENPHPIISVRHLLPDDEPVPDQITAKLTFGGLQGQEVFYDPNGLQAGNELRFVLQADATTLPTGRYKWEIVVTTGTGENAQQHFFSGHREVFNRINSEFGNRMWIAGLDRLIVYADGASLIRGDGTAGWFRKDSNGDFVTPAGSLSTMVKNSDGSYTLLRRWGDRDEFDPAGLLIARVDRHGNQTSYHYTDADSDAIVDELAQVVDPFGRITSYSYSGGLMQSVTLPNGRTTTYQYNANRFLTFVTEEDPDGPGPLAASVTSFEHDAAGRVTRLTDPAGRVTDYAFDFAGRLKSVTTDGNTWAMTAREVQGLVNLSETGFDAANLAASSYLLAQAISLHQDEQGQPTTLKLDAFGYTTARTDALGNQWLYERNEHGQITTAIGPRPDGLQPQLYPITQYGYDAAGNVNHITNPDATTVSFTYETTFNQLVSYTDELGRLTLYEIDPNTGDILEIRRVVGQDDRTSSEADDVVTSFTYTDSSGDLPAGLRLTITDPLGITTSYAYYDNPADHQFGWLQSVTFAMGTADEATLGYQYNVAGNVTAVVDPLGRRTEHEYDKLGRRIQTTLPDPDGSGPQSAPVYFYQYDAIGQLTRQVDPLSRVTEYDYDARGNLIQVTRPDQNGNGQPTIILMSYDAAGRLASVTDPMGQVTSYEYDEIGQLIKITAPDPDGAGPLTAPVTQYSYDALGRLRFITDSLGNVTEHRYDLRDRRIESILPDPDGAGPLSSPQFGYQYDAAGQLVSAIDPLGRETISTYDPLGRLQTRTLPDPDGSGPLAAPQTSFVYDKAGNLVAQTDPLGHTTHFAYDSMHRLTTFTQADPDGSGPLLPPVTLYAYDIAGQLTSITDPLGRQTTRQYDNLGRLTKLTLPDPDGSGPGTSPFTLFGYDAVGNLISQENALGHITTYGYNALNWRTSTTDPNNDTTLFSFDDAGRITSLTDPAGNATHWLYDALGRPVEETNELNDTRYFAFDAAGNLIQRTDRNGRVTQYEYDNLYRPVEERWLDSSNVTLRTLSYTFDAASQMTGAADPAAAYQFNYDALGGATSVTHDLAALTAPILFAQSFDAASNRTQLAATIGSSADFVTDFSYDALRRMTGIQQHGISGGNAVADKRIDLAYNAAGQFSAISRYADVAGTQAVATSDFTYDGTGRLVGLNHAQGANSLADYTWSYDAGNRLTQFTSLQDGIADYTYDDRGQLTGSQYDYQGDESYSYDSNGNRTNTGYSTGANNQLLSDGVYTYQYDAEGNRTKKTEITSGESTEYTWDHRNRLVTVVHLDAVGIPVRTVDYVYDIFDRRIGKSDTPAGSPSEVEAYVYDGAHVALRFIDGQLANRYLHGPAIDQILADEQVDSLLSPGEVLWPLTDHLGTIRDLAAYDPVTDTTSIANHITYDAFGRVTSQSNAAVDHLFGYTGREWDAAVDLQYNRARWFDPATGRWLSQDPIGFAAGDANLYRYVGNRVTVSNDPLGLADIFIGVEADFVPILGIEFGFGLVLDTDTFLDSGMFGNFGPATGLNIGIGAGAGATFGDIEGLSLNLDINAGEVSPTFTVSAPNGEVGGILSAGPGVGASISATKTGTCSLSDIGGFFAGMWPF